MGDGFVSFSLEDLLPRPDFDQGADHEAGQKGDGLVVPVLEQPGQKVGEGQQSGYGTYKVESQARNVKAADALHKILVLDHQDQKETAGDAREDHSADAGGSCYEDEPPGIRGFCRGCQRHPYGYCCAEDEADEGANVPFLDFLENIPAGNQHQAEEEAPGCNRLVVKQIKH